MLNAQEYLELVRNRGERRLGLERIYHNMKNPDLFMMAYGRLYANKGAMTTGSDANDSIDGMSKERINKIIASLEDGTFRWKPAKRIYIPKANGKMRPLGIPSWTDKLVQEVMKLILEAYYEPRFRNCSHGFRPNRGCHTALMEIRREWTGTNWFIEGDIKGCFDNIDHDKLVEIVGRNCKDAKFLKLLREMLKAGYIENFRYTETFSGTPQGGVLSPLLTNIYLHELDRYIEKELIPKYTKGEKRPDNPKYAGMKNKVYNLRKQSKWEEAQELRKELSRTRVTTDTPNYKRLRYKRYADDCLLGLIGTAQDAREIKEALGEFIATLKLEMSQEKTKITNATHERARFLGYEISVGRDDSVRTNGRRSVNGIVMLRVPQDVKEKWVRKYMVKGKIHHVPKLLTNSDFDIISQYSSEIRGLINYYILAGNVSSLDYVRYIGERSLVKTLASKHKQRSSWVYKKYTAETKEGYKCLQVKIERVDKKPLIAEYSNFPIKTKKFAELEDSIPKFKVWSDRTQLEQRMQAEKCELCGNNERVEVHHIKSIKQLIQKYRKRGKEMPEWIKHMAEAFRKTLVVCFECHQKIHSGEYDGRKLS